MDKKDEIILQQLDVIRAMTERNLRSVNSDFWGTPLSPVLTFLLQARPKVLPAQCVGCGKCARVCPAKAIRMQRHRPSIDRKACIRCFCCQEFCPKGAMISHRSAIARLLTP